MPYKCVHCESTYEDGSEEILSGCSNGNCKSKFFFYIRKDKLDEIEKENTLEELDLSSKEKDQMEQDVRDIVGEEDNEKPVFLDFESVKIIKPGKYLLDLGKLFENDRPKIYKLGDGKYVVDLGSIGIRRNK